MTSTMTGDHDAVVEVSETLLTALVSQQLVGVMRFDDGAVRIGSVRVAALAMQGETARVEVRATITHGTMRVALPNTPPRTIRRLRMTLRAAVPIAVQVTGQAVSLAVNLAAVTASDLTIEWAYGALDDLAAQGIPWNDGFDLLARASLAVALKKQVAPPIAVPGVAFDATTDAFPTAAPVKVRRVELASSPKGASSPSVVALLMTFLAKHGDGSVAKRTRTALGNAHALALGLSPDAVRDGLLCPLLAGYFGTTADGLCPACGNGAVSLKDRWNIPVLSRLDLTRIDLRFESGQVVIECAIEGDGPAFTVAGSIALAVTFSLDATGAALVPHASLVGTTLSIDMNVLLDIASGGATKLAAHLAADAVKGLADAKLNQLAASVSQRTVTLPAAPGGAGATYDAVSIDEDGVVLYAKVPLKARVLAAPTFAIDDALTEQRTEVVRGVDGGTCVRQGYDFVDYDCTQTHALSLRTAGLEPLVSAAWSVQGASVPSGGGALSLPATNFGDGADAGDGAVVVDVAVSSRGDAFTLRNRSSDGNYLLGVTCVLDDGVDVYTAYQTLSVDGQPRVFDAQYALDKIHCAQRTVSLRPRASWPASDGPEGVIVAPWARIVGALPGHGPGPTDGPSFASIGWFRAVEGGVMRTAAGEALMQQLVTADERPAIADPSGLRRPQRAVPIAAPVREAPVREEAPAVAPIAHGINAILRDRLAQPIGALRPR